MRFLKRLQHFFVPSRHNVYRPHLLRRGWLVGLLTLALVSEAILVGGLMARHGGQNFLSAVIASEVLSLTNTERVANNVDTLTENPLLDKSAQAKADDMAAKGYFAHVSPDGTQPWDFIDAAGYDYQYAGENLAVRFVDTKDVISAWMASPTHRANIVKPQYTEIGVGIAQGMYKGEPATFVVQHFGRPSSLAFLARAKGQVLGAAVGAPNSSFLNSVLREIGKMLSEPQQSTAWILSSIALLLMLALAFAFFHRVQVQARDLLLPGTLVVVVALTLLFLNTTALSSVNPGGINNQTASVAAAAMPDTTVVIPTDSAESER